MGCAGWAAAANTAGLGQNSSKPCIVVPCPTCFCEQVSADGEQKLYSECVRAGITMLSIGHRPALRQFHSTVRNAAGRAGACPQGQQAACWC